MVRPCRDCGYVNRRTLTLNDSSYNLITDLTPRRTFYFELIFIRFLRAAYFGILGYFIEKLLISGTYTINRVFLVLLNGVFIFYQIRNLNLLLIYQEKTDLFNINLVQGETP